MNKIIRVASILVISTLFISNQLSAQTCAWAKKAGGVDEDWGTSVATDHSGNVYYLGNFYSQTIVIGTTTLHNQPYIASQYGAEMFLAKYDSCGNFKWAKAAGGNSHVYSVAKTVGEKIVTDNLGNVYVGGYTNCDTTIFGTLKLIDKVANAIGFVAKYDVNGNAIWVQEASGQDGNVNGLAVALDPTNNVYVTGTFASTYIKIGTDSVRNKYPTYNSVFIAKFDNNGNIQWVRNGGGNNGDSFGYGIGTDASGNVYVGGTFGSDSIRFGTNVLPLNGYYDIFVVKYNTSGTFQWLKGAGSTDDDEAFGLASDASGNVYITGYIGVNSTVSFGTHSITNTTNSLNPFIAKYNSAGADQWARVCQVDNFSYSQGNEIKLDAAGNPYIIGYYSSDSIKIGAVTLYNNSIATYGGGDTLRDIFVAKYKSNGNLSWARTAGGKSNDYGNGIATGSNNSVYITGEFLSDSISFAGILLARTNLSIAGDGDAFIANNISTNPIVPNICMVTVDTVLAQNNIIVWDKTPYVNLADSFIVYREISTNNYQPIGAVPYSAMSTFTDTVRHKYSNTGDPNAGTYRYKISLRDTSGNYSMLSPYHNTIYITNSNGTFSWPQLYTIENGANPVTNYALMRDDNSTGNWHMINSIAGTQQSVTDPNYSGFTANGAWRVQTIWNINCIPSIINNDPQIMTISLNSSRSNVYRVNGNGIQEFGNTLQVDLFPNPSTGIFSMEVGNNLNQYKIEICNVLGEKVYSATTNNHSTIIHLDSPSGVYFLTIKSENGTAVKKIIKE